MAAKGADCALAPAAGGGLPCSSAGGWGPSCSATTPPLWKGQPPAARPASATSPPAEPRAPSDEPQSRQRPNQAGGAGHAPGAGGFLGRDRGTTPLSAAWNSRNAAWKPARPSSSSTGWRPWLAGWPGAAAKRLAKSGLCVSARRCRKGHRDTAWSSSCSRCGQPMLEGVLGLDARGRAAVPARLAQEVRAWPRSGPVRTPGGSTRGWQRPG